MVHSSLQHQSAPKSPQPIKIINFCEIWIKHTPNLPNLIEITSQWTCKLKIDRTGSEISSFQTNNHHPPCTENFPPNKNHTSTHPKASPLFTLMIHMLNYLWKLWTQKVTWFHLENQLWTDTKKKIRCKTTSTSTHRISLPFHSMDLCKPLQNSPESSADNQIQAKMAMNLDLKTSFSLF